MAVSSTVSFLKETFKGAQVATTLGDALCHCKGTASGKSWAVLPCGDASLREVHKVLADGSKELGVVVVAENGPVSQIEVLRAMEYGGVFAAAAVNGASAAAVLKEASSFADGPSVVLLASPATVQGDSKWTPFTYDPRREAAGAGNFVAAGDRVRKEIQAFLDRENLLTLIAKKSIPAEPPRTRLATLPVASATRARP
jgi:hypothetical protein